MPSAPTPPPQITLAPGVTLADEDTSDLMGGRVRVVQPRRGYRAGLDAGLLAASVGGRAGERILEAGCGVGAALLQAAARAPQTRFVGLERDPGAFALAQRNLISNAMADRIEVSLGDVADQLAPSAGGAFDAAFANPPFFDDPGALRGPAPERRGAWLSDAGLAVWVRYLVTAAREGGRVILIHRADRLGDILAALATRPAAGSIQIRPVQPFVGRPAKRVLVHAVRAGRAPLMLLSPLVLHDDDSRPTPEARSILRGEAELPWITRSRQSA